jgi:hypothetical protein
MIEFGLFSSHIPYAIFIAVYMLYFGASALNKHDTGDKALETVVSETHLTPDNRYDSKTLVYRVGSQIRSEAEKCTGIPIYFQIHAIPKKTYGRADILPVFGFFCNSGFSRPPPFSA